MYTTLHLFSDGGSRGNPGPAAIGAVLQQPDGTHLAGFKDYLGEATNNQAEYRALLLGIQKAKEYGAHTLHCFLDSELVVKQLRREYKIKDPNLSQLFIKIWNISQGFEKIDFTHIPREKNKEADLLVNQALDEALKK